MKRVGDYDLESVLGQGCFGTVYYGRNRLDNSEVAVKMIPLRGLTEDTLISLEREIKTLSETSSAYVISLKNVLKTTNNLYLFMEYCRGGDLEKYLKTRTRLSEDLAQKWIYQILQALINLKKNHIMHRDLKLANILLTEAGPNGDVRIADFGFARQLEENGFAMTRLGTPLFMAPEIFTQEPYTYKADVWSLGCISYQLLVGELPFVCTSILELVKKQKEPVSFPPNLPISREAKEFILSVLIHNPSRRPDHEDLLRMPFMENRRRPTSDNATNFQEVIPQIDKTDSVHMYSNTSVNIIEDDISMGERILELHDSCIDSGNKYAAVFISYYCSNIFFKMYDSITPLYSDWNFPSIEDAVNALRDRLDRSYQRARDMFSHLGGQLGILVDRNVSEEGFRLMNSDFFKVCEDRVRREGLTSLNKRLLEVVLYYNPGNTQAQYLLANS